MKQTPQLDSKYNPLERDERDPRVHSPFPAIDYEYRPTTTPVTSGSTVSGKKFIKLGTFRKVSGEFLETETPRDFVTELALFVFVGGICAWSFVSVAVAVTRMVRGW